MEGILLMKLTDLTEGTEITVNAYSEYDSIEFKTKCVQVLGKSILVESIREETEPINFKSDIVKLDVSISHEGESPIIWKNVAITYISYLNQEFHSITAFTEGFEFNRRKAYREYIGMNGTVQIGINTMAYDVIVKDISSTGFAFITSENWDIIKQLAHLVFQDKDKASFNIHGQVVRKQFITDHKIVYGCETTIPYDAIDKYIMLKQRERVQNKMK